MNRYSLGWKKVCQSTRADVASVHLSLDLFNLLYGFKKKTKKKNLNCDCDSNLVSQIKPSIPINIPKIIGVYRDHGYVFFSLHCSDRLC